MIWYGTNALWKGRRTYRQKFDCFQIIVIFASRMPPGIVCFHWFRICYRNWNWVSISGCFSPLKLNLIRNCTVWYIFYYKWMSSWPTIYSHSAMWDRRMEVMSQWVSEPVQNDPRHTTAIKAKYGLSPKIPLIEWTHRKLP